MSAVAPIIEENQIQEEQNTNKYASMTIAELRKERENQVQQLAFENVALIDEAIRNHHEDTTEKVYNEEAQKLSELIDTIYKRYDNTINLVNEKADQKEHKYRSQTIEIIEKVKERHNQKKKDLETAKEFSMIRAAERRSVKDQELKEKAKNLARQGEIEDAIQYRDESEQLKEKEIKARQNDINCRFQRMIDHLQSQEAINMRIVEDNFSRAIDRIQTEKEDELRTSNQALKINIAYALQKAINSGTKNVKREKRTDFIQRINGFVQNKIETEQSI